MKYLLDTHVVLWWLGDSDRLNDEARGAIDNVANQVLVSSASVWEIEIKRAKGALVAPDDLLDRLSGAQFELVSITPEHAAAAGRLPRHHDDPFDRMLIAQAFAESAVLLTADHAPVHYGVPIQQAG